MEDDLDTFVNELPLLETNDMNYAVGNESKSPIKNRDTSSPSSSSSSSSSSRLSSSSPLSSPPPRASVPSTQARIPKKPKLDGGALTLVEAVKRDSGQSLSLKREQLEKWMGKCMKEGTSFYPEGVPKLLLQRVVESLLNNDEFGIDDIRNDIAVQFPTHAGMCGWGQFGLMLNQC